MLREFLSRIANAIRTALGTTDTINAQSFPDKISEVYEAGEKSEYDRFWDIYQDNGKRTIYQYAFGGSGWNENTFKPKYDIRVTSALHLFSYCQIVNISDCLKNAGVKFDTSLMNDNNYILQNNKVTKVFPEVSFESKKGTIGYAFYNNEVLKVIENVILKNDGSQTFSDYSFGQLPALEEIRFEGVIGQNGFNMKWSTKLSKDSITSIINALSTTTSGLTITLSKVAVNNAFETSEGAGDGSTSEEWNTLIATKSNWTISLV